MTALVLPACSWLVVVVVVLVGLALCIQSHPKSWLRRSWEQPLDGESTVFDTHEAAERHARLLRSKGVACFITAEPFESWIEEPYDRWRVTTLAR